ncbi:MAG: response regulator [Chloroflexota bacterium]
MKVEQIKLLLIEDDPADVRLVQELLLENSPGMFLLHTVGQLNAGLDMIKEQDFDIILLDLTLPDSEGIDSLLWLRSESPDIPIIVLTGFDDMTNMGIEAVQGGAQDYLTKGDIDSKLLRRSIRYAIERHDIDMRLRRSEQEYRSLIDDVFDTSMVAVIILNSDFTVVWCNEATEVYFGIERETILGRDKRLLIDSHLKCVFADPEDYAGRLLKAYEARSYTDRFECHVTADGSRTERWLEHWSQPIRDGRYVGGRIEQYTDITDRKLLEIAGHEEREFAEALHDLATTLTSTLDLDEVLGRILSNLGRVVPHDSASITMVADDHLWVARQQHTDSRNTQKIVAERQLRVAYSHYHNEMALTKSPILIQDLHQDEHYTEQMRRTSARAYMGAPIQVRDQVSGFIGLFNRDANTFRESDVKRLHAFAELAAIAIQNAQLYEQSHELAAVEERQRLARELHDSVSQSLFTCRSMVESALRIWDHDPSQAHELIEYVNQQTITALTEMRVLLLELRPSALTQISLKQLFEQYLDPIKDRYKTEFSINIDDVPDLPGRVQLTLYRITQEALHNINKHARASIVDVQVTYNAEHIVIEIRDNGVGFDLTQTDSTSMGLNIMKERAAEIEADIAIDSVSGEGTRIRVQWPWPRKEG